VRVDLLDAYAVSGDDVLILTKSMISKGKNDQEIRAVLFDSWYRTKFTGPAIILKKSRLPCLNNWRLKVTSAVPIMCESGVGTSRRNPLRIHAVRRYIVVSMYLFLARLFQLVWSA
jgi:hypothetical protein